MMSDKHERTGFWATLRGMITDGMDVEVAIAQLLDQPEYKQNLITILSGVARNQIFRTPARHAEQIASAALERKHLGSARQALVAQTFALPGGGFVEWTKATAADHRERAHWFKNQIDSMSKTVSLHELSARLIEDAGVTCLAEIESIEAWPELAQKTLPIETKSSAVSQLESSEQGAIS